VKEMPSNSVTNSGNSASETLDLLVNGGDAFVQRLNLLQQRTVEAERATAALKAARVENEKLRAETEARCRQREAESDAKVEATKQRMREIWLGYERIATS
jgi:hypothetical protein